MSFYSYDVSLNISASAVDVGVPDRGTKSSDIKVDSNINWINASVEQDVELPTGSERFIFDMNNPLSWPGTGATIFDLSGNGYDCEHAQLGLLYDDPAADTATDAPCSWDGQTGFNFTDDSTVLDYIDTGSNIDGRTYLHINPDLENENVKYIRWPAPGTNADNFTFFMVTEGVFIDDYEPSSTINPDVPEIDDDPNGDFTIAGDLSSPIIGIRSRINKGYSFRGPQDFYQFVFRPPGLPVTIYGRSYSYVHGKRRAGGRSVRTPTKYFLDDNSYLQDVLDAYGEFINEDLEDKSDANNVGTNLGTAQIARFDHTNLQVFSVTHEGTKARTYINGEYIGEIDISGEGFDAVTPYWTAGIAQNNNSSADLQDYLRACSARENKFYAWGFYDRALTTDENLQIHKKYLRHPNPVKPVDVSGIPAYALFNVRGDVGRPDVDVSVGLTTFSSDLAIDYNNGVDRSYNVSLDLSSPSVDVSIDPLP